MDSDCLRVLAGLVAVAASIGVEVKSTALRGTRPGGGGLCRVNGKLVVLLNSKSSAAERSITLAEALHGLDLAGASIDAELRAYIEHRGRRPPPRSGVRSSGAGLGPGLASTSPDGKRRRHLP